MTTERRIIAEQAIEIRLLKDKVDDLEWKNKNLLLSIESYREIETKLNKELGELQESKKDLEELSAYNVKLIYKNTQLTDEIESLRKELDSTTEALFEAMNSIKGLKDAYNETLNALKNKKNS